jgi:hypothetical protein
MRMSDLIDREALLRQIDIDSEGEPGYYGDTWKFIDTIKSMPPAELSTNLASLGTDCISRQAAIDAIGKVSDELYENIKKGATFPQRQWFDGMAQAQSILENLPSAQPEEASVILGVSKDGVRLWYKCSVCGEPANADDNYCCNCGRKFING